MYEPTSRRKTSCVSSRYRLARFLLAPRQCRMLNLYVPFSAIASGNQRTLLLKTQHQRLPKTPRQYAQIHPSREPYSKNPITNLSASKISPPQTTNSSRSVRTVSQPPRSVFPRGPRGCKVESNSQSQILLTGAFCTFPPFFFSSRRSTSGCALPRLAASLRA